MAKYRHTLPQRQNKLFLTDGRLETTLIFHEGIDLPEFSAFVLLETDQGRQTLAEYFDRYLPLAIKNRSGFILESVTWRANPKWGGLIGYSKSELAKMIHGAIEFLEAIRDQYETEECPMPISGCIGPKGDGYIVSDQMTAEEAEEYHSEQTRTFSETETEFLQPVT